MPTPYHAIYLAPHLDDAALSCGGQIAQRTAAGERVLIVTVMAGDPSSGAASEYIESLHTRWQLADDAAAQRRAEDARACALLGADFVHLGAPDCIYRLHPETSEPFYTSDPDIFGDVHPLETGMVEQIATELATLPAASDVFAPLTLGHHVDHLLVRQAAEQVWGTQLGYYEDYPYAQKAGALEQVIGAGDVGWQPSVIPLADVDQRRKISAILAFVSQMSTFFTDENDLNRQVRGYAQQVGGERIWRRVGLDER